MSLGDWAELVVYVTLFSILIFIVAGIISLPTIWALNYLLNLNIGYFNLWTWLACLIVFILYGRS